MPQGVVAVAGRGEQPATMSVAADIGTVCPGRDLDWIAPDWATSDRAALEAAWRDLETRADGSFFQSWTWVGCEVRHRFTDPLLLRATQRAGDGGRRVVGLALFNRTGPPALRRLHLHETGRRDADSVFIEHNGPLLARGHEDLLQPMLIAALRQGALALSGVSRAVREAAQALGRCRVVASRPAPFVTLEGRTAASWLAGLGPASRARLRRSRRSYEAAGPLVARQAESVAEGLAFLDALAGLHQASWRARGRSGAFATPAFLAFHRALVARGLPRGEVELLRVATVTPLGLCVVGYLYNFRWRGKVCAYQSGLNYAAAGPRESPGLMCHQAAIEAAIDSGCRFYDFLAGAARYKTSLGDGEAIMDWLDLTRPGTPGDVLQILRRGVRQLRTRPQSGAAVPQTR